MIISVGRQINREDARSRDEVASSDDRNHIRERDGDQLSGNRTNIKRYRHERRVTSDSDDSSDGPSPMVFHNYAKRRRFSETEDEYCIR